MLRNINFTAPAGATIGVVGATASGKSALMDLVPRFFDPQEGEILIDGVPIRELDLAIAAPRDRLRPAGELPVQRHDREQPRLWHTTTPTRGRGRPSIAQLAETIEAFPGGYDTVLGERGINLSGGQKQRAALARALARRPEHRAARRCALGGGHAHRGGDPAVAARGAGRPHGAHRVASRERDPGRELDHRAG